MGVLNSIDDYVSLENLHSKCKSLLSFSSIEESFLSTYESVLPYANGEKTLENKDGFVSFVFLLDKVNSIYYPLYFKQIKNNVLTGESPIFNPLAISLLKNLSLDFNSENAMSFVEMTLELDKQIELKKVRDCLDLRFAIYTLSAQDILFVKAFSTLDAFVKTGDIDLKYHGLFKEVKDNESEEKIKKNDIGVFTRFDKASSRLENYTSAKISYQSLDILNDIIHRLIDESLEDDKTLLFVLPIEEKNTLLKNLEEEGLGDFIYDYSADEQSQASKIQKRATTNKDELVEKCDAFEKASKKYLNFLGKRREAYKGLELFKSADALSFLSEKHSVSQIPSLDISDYSAVDRDADYDFLNWAEGKDIDTIYAKSELQGLTWAGDLSSYERLVSLFNEALSIISAIETDAKIKELEDGYGVVLSDYQALTYWKETFELLEEYNGFPQKYFSLDYTQTVLPLDDLKRYYQDLSSSSRLIDNLFNPGIYALNLSDVSANLTADSLFAKHKGKRAIYKVLKNKKNRDFKTISRVLDSYLAAREKLDEVLPLYVKAYGESVVTLNGVIEIESNVKVIKKFYEYAKEHQNFSLDQPLIKKYLKDKDFRTESQEIIHKVDDYRLKLEEIFKEINRAFYEKQIAFTSLSFAEIKNKLENLSQIDFKSYQEYCQMRDHIKSASFLLQLTVKGRMRNGLSFLDFTQEYKLALIQSAYKRGRENFAPYLESFKKVEEDFFTSLESYKEVSEAERLLKCFNWCKNKAGSHNPLFMQFPLVLISAEELFEIEENSFDHTVIFDSGLFTNIELFSAYQTGKDVLILNDRSIYDMRTQLYHDAFINRDNLYKDNLNLNQIPEKFYKIIENDFQLHADERFQMISQNGEKEYAILPSSSLSRVQDDEYLLELAKFLIEQEHLLLYCFDPYLYLLEK